MPYKAKLDPRAVLCILVFLTMHDSYVHTYVCICDQIRENQLGFHTHLIFKLYYNGEI